MIYLAQTPAEEAGCLPTGEVCLCKMLLVRKNFIIFESLLFESAGEDRPEGAASAKPPRRLASKDYQTRKETANSGVKVANKNERQSQTFAAHRWR